MRGERQNAGVPEQKTTGQCCSALAPASGTCPSLRYEHVNIGRPVVCNACSIFKNIKEPPMKEKEKLYEFLPSA